MSFHIFESNMYVIWLCSYIIHCLLVLSLWSYLEIISFIEIFVSSANKVAFYNHNKSPNYYSATKTSVWLCVTSNLPFSGEIYMRPKIQHIVFFTTHK